MFRAFYRPSTGSNEETFEDAEKLELLPSGAILIIRMNEDGTREIIENEKEKRSLTPKEDKFHKWAERHLEFKHDGGDTPDMYEHRRIS